MSRAGYLFGQKRYIKEYGFGIQDRVSSNKKCLVPRLQKESGLIFLQPEAFNVSEMRLENMTSWRVHCNTHYHCTPVLTTPPTKSCEVTPLLLA